MEFEAGRTLPHREGLERWIFLDIGFAGEDNKSCGIAFEDEPAEVENFSGATCKIIRKIREWTDNARKDSSSPISLVIEAPLSVRFVNGNPAGRKVIEKQTQNKKRFTRYWFQSGGCVVMVAALFLIRKIEEKCVARGTTIHLFEGFVSYKKRRDEDGKALPKSRKDHKRDVYVLRKAVRGKRGIFEPDQLWDKDDEKDSLISALDLIGIKCEVPIVLKRQRRCRTTPQTKKT